MKFNFLYNIIFIFIFIIMYQVRSLAEAIGPGGSGGGNGVILNDQVYLLDFIETGMQENININFGIIQNSSQVPDSKSNLNLANDANLVVLKFEDHEEYRSVSSLANLESILSKSNPENNYLFGKKIINCKDVIRVCLTPDSEIAIALVNKFFTLENSNDFIFDLFLKKFSQLNWVTVDAPLKSIADENSAIEDQTKYLLARRDDQLISIFSGSWAKGFRKENKPIKPLNRLNQIGLITHEVFYAMTAQQGDTVSDRARKINALFWGNGFRNDYIQVLFTIPGHPVKNLEQAILLNNIPIGQEIIVNKDLIFTETDKYVIVPNLPLMTEKNWFFNYQTATQTAAIHLYNEAHFFMKGTLIPKGLHLKIKKTEIKILDHWVQTVVYFEQMTNFENELIQMTVTGSKGGIYPVSIKDFKETMKEYFQFAK